MVWQHVLSQYGEDSGNVAVKPLTSLEYFDYGSFGAALESMNSVKEGLVVDGYSLGALVDQLFEHNDSSVSVTLRSKRESGFIVDTGNTYTTYFTSREGGGWDQWYQDHPNSLGIVTVSRPVCDAEVGIVLVYRGKQEHWLSGKGWVIAYRIEDSTLIAVDSVMLWIS
jgi:hypothetical protein